MIIAFALMADFADIEAALLRQIGRIDHVHGVAIGPHQSGQHGCRNWLLVQFSRRAFYFHGDALDLVSRELAHERPQLRG